VARAVPRNYLRSPLTGSAAALLPPPSFSARLAAADAAASRACVGIGVIASAAAGAALGDLHLQLQPLIVRKRARLGPRGARAEAGARSARAAQAEDKEEANSNMKSDYIAILVRLRSARRFALIAQR